MVILRLWKIVFHNKIINKRERGKIKKIPRSFSEKINSQIISQNSCKIGLYLEAATRGVLGKKVFLEISQNSQENTCARASLLIKLQA